MATVLICEDDPAINGLVSRFCEDLGHTVASAGTGAEAISLAVGLKPELIILDIGLPGDLSGYEVCTHLRQDAGTSRAHIVILTAGGGASVEMRATDAGANEVIWKPFRLNTIEDMLTRVLG